MRKKMIMTTAAVLMAGIIGALLRYWEVLTIFDPVTGLADKYALPSVLLIVLTLAVMVTVCCYAISLAKNEEINVNQKRPFPVSGKLSLTAITVIGVIVILGSVFNYVVDTGETVIFRGIFAILGIGTGIAIIADASASYKGDESKMGLLSCIATLLLCWWLIMTYVENNNNPVLLEYCYECLAAIGATLSFYYATGNYYGKFTPKRTIIAHFLGAYFCFVTVLDAGNVAQGVMFVALAIYQLIRGCAFISGAPKMETIEE